MRYADDIEFILINIEAIKKAVIESRVSGNRTGHTGGNGSGHSRVSDPTAIKAIRNISEVPVITISYGPYIAGCRECKTIKHPELWIKVAESVIHYYLKNARMHDFFHRRYQLKEDWEKTCKELNMGRGAYYAMKADVLHMAELYAVHYGLLVPASIGFQYK